MAQARTDNIISAFTEEQAERLTGVSRRQLRYWAKDFYFPSVSVDIAASAELKLYSFRDLVCLKVLNALRNDAKIPLQELRRTKVRLGHLGDDVWAKVTLYVWGKKVVFDNPHTGEKEEAASGQGVLQIPLRIVAGEMTQAIYKLRGRRDDLIGRIEQKRNVAQNQPVVAGTRIPVRSIQAFLKAGYSVEEINKQYPTLSREDIAAAADYKEVA